MKTNMNTDRRSVELRDQLEKDINEHYCPLCGTETFDGDICKKCLDTLHAS